MQANKSPGPYGFSAEFYKKCWKTIKGDFMKMLDDFVRFGSLDWRLNCSFITLIPKKEDPCTPKDFRPLSLIGSLISDFQGAFINDRQILDGVLISNECVDSRLKSKMPGVLCKVDMEKSFDNINWQAIFCILHKHDFGEK